MSESQDNNYISHYLNWIWPESIHIETEMTRDNFNRSNSSQHESNDYYQTLCELSGQQNIEEQNKTILDVSTPTLIAPNHAFWNSTKPSEVAAAVSMEEESNSEYFKLANKYQLDDVQNHESRDHVATSHLQTKLPCYSFKPCNEIPYFRNLVPSYPPPGYFQDKKEVNKSVGISTLVPQQQPCNLNNKSYLKPHLPVYNTDGLNLPSQIVLERKGTGVWMFVDNSNIWIECKRAEAKLKFKKNPLFDEDPRLRLDMGRLAEQVRGGRPIIDAQLYGSEPPEIDTIWQLATKRGWEVNRFKRNLISGKEKQLDTSIVADITELVCHSQVRKLKFAKYKNVIVLVAGDSDFIPAIRKVIAQSGWWRIEVWGLAHSMSNAIKQLSKEYPEILEIHYMDKEEIKKQFTFTHYKLDLKWNVDTDAQVLMYNYGIVFEDVHIWLGSMVKFEFQRTIKGLQWPYKFCWMDDRKTKWDGNKNLLVLFERPNARLKQQDPNKEKFDFLNKYLPRLKSSKLKRLCGRILSYHEYDKETNDLGDRISLSNRFNCLSNISEVEDLFDLDNDEAEDDDDNGIDTNVFNLTEEKVVEQVSSPEPQDEEWEQVINKTKCPKTQLYSTLCKYGAICIEGLTCTSKHTAKEKQIFDSRRIAKSLYGHEFFENKYRTELCNKNWCDQKVCRFAHGPEQLVCRLCCKIGHATETCTKKSEM